MPTDWWRDFFHGLPASFWHACVPAALTQAEAGFLARTFAPGSRMLDVPCGDGRLTCALAQQGYRVTGVDLSSTFLGWARAAGAGLPVDFHERDMRDLPWPAAFNGAFCFGNSFGYLDEAGDAAFLAAVRRTLRPGGVFVLDAATAEAGFPVFQPERRHEADGYVMESKVTWDADAGYFRSDYTFRHDGETEQKSAWHRVRMAQQVAALLRGSGFGSVRILGGLDGRALQPVAGHRALFVAEA